MRKNLIFLIFLLGCQPNREMTQQPSFSVYEKPQLQQWILQADERAVLYDPNPLSLPVTMEFLDFGEKMYRLHCSNCHGLRGEGQGLIPQHGFEVFPPSFHAEDLRNISPEEIFEVLTFGKGRMLPVAHRLGERERWAISHFVKVLQISKELEKPR